MREGMKYRFPIKNVGNDEEGRGLNDGSHRKREPYSRRADEWAR
jgi:hypothetical protein